MTIVQVALLALSGLSAMGKVHERQRTMQLWRNIAPFQKLPFLRSSENTKLARRTGRMGTCVSSASVKSDVDDRRTLVKEFEVYIEDTDAFQVVFYGNYVKFFERQIQERMYEISGDEWHLSSVGLPTILHIENFQYKVAARLGELLRLTSTVVDIKDNAVTEHMRLEVLGDPKLPKSPVVCNEATVTWGYQSISTGEIIPLPDMVEKWGAVVKQVGNLDFEAPVTKKRRSSIESYRLEMDFGRLKLEDIDASGFIAPASVMRYFERVRSRMIGGPKTLRRLAEENTSIFVTKISDLRFGLYMTQSHRPSSNI